MSDQLPVIIDLDGTLLATDTLLESFALLLKKNPLYVFLIPFWLLKGKAYLKNAIADRVELDLSSLPYNQDVIDYIKAAKAQGHAIYLATGAVEKYANAVSNHLRLFDGVFSSSREHNLTGSKKLEKLTAEFGEKKYIYLGNHSVDLKIWSHAKTAVVVSSSQSLLAKASSVCEDTSQIETEKPSLKTLLKAIRVHQWVKNALIFVPLLTSHQFLDSNLIIQCLFGFISFSLCASSVYVLNDIVDLESDRKHPSKKNRPFASAKLSVLTGLFLFPCLLVVGFSLCFFVNVDFAIALLCYYIITLAYSFGLKRIIMLDTIVLAVLYTMRIIAGTLLIAADFSFWLLAFSMFIFLSLALVKRYTELVLMRQEGEKKVLGRGYHAEDAEMVSSLGGASGYIAVMVFALYVNSPDVAPLYSNPSVLWLACPILLYWISRVWLIAHRGQMHDDPIVFAVKDLQSLVTGIIVLAIFGVAT